MIFDDDDADATNFMQTNWNNATDDVSTFSHANFQSNKISYWKNNSKLVRGMFLKL